MKRTSKESKRISVPSTSTKIVKKQRTVVKKSHATQLVKNQLVKKIEPGTSSRPNEETTAMDRALEYQATLPPNSSFVKLMRESHVTKIFWLGLNKQFCLKHLPKRDVSTVFLVDENEVEYETKLFYRPNGNGFGLSGGWVAFAKAKHLHEEDVLIFQLVRPCKLKVHIFRALETGNQEIVEPPMLDKWSLEQTLELIENYDPATDPFGTEVDNSIEDLERTGALMLNDNGTDGGNGVEDLERIEFSLCDANFRNIKEFDDFIIEVDGVNLNSKIPSSVRRKYHDLCSSQNVLLHENIMKELDCRLVAGIICDIVIIADSIKGLISAKSSISSVARWGQTLEAFEGLGMRVTFLRDTVSKLLDVLSEVASKN